MLDEGNWMLREDCSVLCEAGRVFLLKLNFGVPLPDEKWPFGRGSVLVQRERPS